MTPTERLAALLDTDDPPLGESLLLLSSALTRRDDAVAVGLAQLDDLAAGVDEPTIPGLLQHLFGRVQFGGDITDYHAPENSFLDRVLERRLGMPITLSAVVAEVGQRVGLKLHLIGMPGHVLVGIDDSASAYIDAFAGVALDEDGVRQRFESIFGAGTALAPHALQPIDTLGVLTRVCNNLTRSWIERDPASLNALLDLRAELPSSTRERQLLIGLAEGRGRFDLAARLRSEIDPDDPTIERLWARLN